MKTNEISDVTEDISNAASDINCENEELMIAASDKDMLSQTSKSTTSLFSYNSSGTSSVTSDSKTVRIDQFSDSEDELILSAVGIGMKHILSIINL